MDAEERKLWQRLAQAKRQATVERLRNVLVERYLPLARAIAGTMARKLPASLDYGDIESAAYQGLIDAVPRFDLTRGLAPQTFLTWRVRGSIRDWLRDSAPQSRLQLQRLAEQAEWQQRVLGRPATDDELHEQFGDKAVREALTFSLSSERVGEWRDGDATRCDNTPATQTVSADCGDLAWLLRGLSQRERLIVICYYVEGLRMKQIGHQLGISESRVSQMMTDIVARIKRNAAA